MSAASQSHRGLSVLQRYKTTWLWISGAVSEPHGGLQVWRFAAGARDGAGFPRLPPTRSAALLNASSLCVALFHL